MIRSSIGNSRTMQSSFNFQPSQTPGMLASGEHEQFEPVLKQISALNFQKIFHIYELTVRVSDGTNGATARGGSWGSLPESPHAESAARTKAAGRNRANGRPRLSGDTRNVMRTRTGTAGSLKMCFSVSRGWTGSRLVMGRILVQENPKRNFRFSWLRGDVRGDEALESARRLPKWQETGHPEPRGLAPRGLQRIGLPKWQESKRHRDD